MKKIFFLLSILCLVGCSKTDKTKDQASNNTVKIGVMAAMSGDLAFFGESIVESLKIAQENIKTLNPKLNYEVVVEDCEYSQSKTAMAAQKLVNVDHVDAVIATFEMHSNIFAPLAEKFKIPNLAMAINPAVAKGRYNFTTYTPVQVVAEKFVESLKKRNITTVAIFSLDDPYCHAQVLAAREAFKKGNIQIVADEVLPASMKDYRSSIQKAKNKNPDFYVLLTFSPTFDILFKQCQDLGIGQNIGGMEAYDNVTEPKKYEGLWYVGVSNPSDKFIQRFKQAKNYFPPISTTQAYDSFMLIVTASENFYAQHGRKPASDEITDEIMKLKSYNGESGHLTQDEEGVFWTKAVEKIIKNGEPFVVEESK
jgi:ABC-type branched-subunit amino acid transport system substrate-binding protein